MITVKDVEEAIAVTKDRWEKMAQCKDYDELTLVINNSLCGLCSLSRNIRNIGDVRYYCMFRLCPFLHDEGCHPAYLAYSDNESIDKIISLSKQLLKDLDNIDKVSLVKKVNKALRRHHE